MVDASSVGRFERRLTPHSRAHRRDEEALGGEKAA